METQIGHSIAQTRRSQLSVPWYRSLNIRLGAAIAVGILISSGLTSGVMIHRAMERQQVERKIELQSLASVMASNLSEAVASGDRKRLNQTLRSINGSSRIVSGEVRDRNDRHLASMGGKTVLIGSRAPEGVKNPVSVRTAITHQGRHIGAVILVSEVDPGMRVLRSAIIESLLFSLLAAILGGTITITYQRKLMKPLQRLTSKMNIVRDEDSAPTPLRIKATGEIGVLVDSYNDMIEEICTRERALQDHQLHLSELVSARTEEAQSARLEAERANDAKSRFLASMSHEIRTPMNGMLVMAEMLTRSSLPPTQSEYANIIHRSGGALLELLNDILDLSKVEAGELVLESVPFNVDDCVSDSLAIFWQKVTASGVRLTSYIDPSVPASLAGDSHRLRQCLSNLIGNAAKFTKDGVIHTSVRWQEAHNAGEAGYLRIEVRDTGPGIRKDRLEEIFKAFVQENDATTRAHGGTGLGLAITSQLVDAMGGKIGVESELGSGSTFFMDVPFQPLEAAQPLRCDTDTRVVIELPNHHETAALSEALSARGITVVASGDAATPDCRIVSSKAPRTEMQRSGIPAVAYWRLGDTEPHDSLRDGTFVDVLRVPYSRNDIDILVGCIASGAFRGAEAINSIVTPAESAVQQVGHVRVLVADDTESNRYVIEEALSVFGIDAVIVNDGVAAVEAFAKEPFDIVLLDGNMDVMSGYEAARQIRMECKATPLILFSATMQNADDDVTADRFTDFLPKPFTMDQLGGLLSRYCTSDALRESGQDGFTKEPTATDGDEPAVLSSAMLESLRQLDRKRPGAFRKIFASFTENLPGAIERVDTALKADSVEDLRLAAHFLKSSASGVGALRLADLAAKIENAARDARAGDRPVEFGKAVIEDLRDAAFAVNEQIDQELPRIDGQAIAT